MFKMPDGRCLITYFGNQNLGIVLWDPTVWPLNRHIFSWSTNKHIVTSKGCLSNIYNHINHIFVHLLTGSCLLPITVSFSLGHGSRSPGHRQGRHHLSFPLSFALSVSVIPSLSLSLSSALKGYSQTWTAFGLCSGNRDSAEGSLPFKERSPYVDN